VLEEGALTIGFARRVAEYKRGTLLFLQPDRLRSLLLDTKRPVQLVISGKAHPADEKGKHIIQALSTAARDPELRRRLVFLEDYDMAIGSLLYQGADVWLNTPRRPLEACGTSGQKAALSGALNCSILDGWWDEAFDGHNGFAIPSFEEVTNLEERDRLEVEALYQVLEDQVLPLFFERDPEGLPSGWLQMIHRSLSTVAPLVLGSRMVADYVRQLYQPAAAAASLVSADRYRVAREAVVRAERVRRNWPLVSVVARGTPVQGLAAELPYGGERAVEAMVDLAELRPEDVEVQLLHGPLGADGQLAAPEVERMRLEPSGVNPHFRYVGRLPLVRPGPYGFTVRVMPRQLGLDAPPPASPVRLAEPPRLRQ
jgi:starch phosphorylase